MLKRYGQSNGNRFNELTITVAVGDMKPSFQDFYLHLEVRCRLRSMNICLRSYVHLMCFNNTIYLYLRVGRIISGNIGKLRFIESLGAVPEFTCNGGLLYVGSSVAELATFVFAPKLAPLFNKLCVSIGFFCFLSHSRANMSRTAVR
ncbi:hypothetical protein T4D_7314 [Trichinella pseudospiralis]|uniref:Uncharacterized protein n=1 Tax=Trichinella pseudospiralis TaxID=6337 RepID=A0A0V1F3S8_TRIPS|nr:hypothetical protein T4D_7314 [Trichinella pseudospiralis]